MKRFAIFTVFLSILLCINGNSVAATITFSEVILGNVQPLAGTTAYESYGISFGGATWYSIDSRFLEDGYGIGTGSNQIIVNFLVATNSVNFNWVGGQALYATAYDASDNIIDDISFTGLPGGVIPNYGSGNLAGGLISKIIWNDGQSQFGIDSISFNATTQVPEPATMVLLGSGLLGLVGYSRRKFKKS